MNKRSLCGTTPDDISELIASAGYDHSQAVLIARGFYRKRVNDIAGLTGIRNKLKFLLDEIFTPGVFGPEPSQVSIDGSVKYLFRAGDGRAFETVYIPDEKRNTVCVSTQSGCKMGCPFCMTSRYGFHGDLTAGEIINQIISIPDAAKIDHIVFMGMGEPMENLGEVLKACEIITSEWGLAISPGNVTVSTVGITPAVRSFLDLSQCNLAVSLYSPFKEERIKAVPAEKKYPVHEIIEMLKNYPLKKKRRISIAYMMIDRVNDSEAHLEGLRQLLSGSGIRVNLLPYHNGNSDTGISSTGDRMLYFKHNLVLSGVPASIRRSRGSDISAACGLLAAGLKK